MALPPFAPIPPGAVRLGLAPEEWQACLDAWLTLSEVVLRLPDVHFKQSYVESLALPSFLQSYYSALSSLGADDHTFSGTTARQLQKTISILTKRVILETNVLYDLGWVFLSNYCHAHIRSKAIVQSMRVLSKRKQDDLAGMFQSVKNTMTEHLESSTPRAVDVDLARLAPIVRTSADVGAFFLTGSDFLDALVSAYEHSPASEQKKMLSSIAYWGLVALVVKDEPNPSALSDHLYALKAHADKKRGESSLLADLVTNTPLIVKLRRTVDGKAAERLNKLLDTLETYRMSSIARSRPHRPSKISKGKAKQSSANDELHIHHMSLVTQIQDLFPDLGAGFILRLLDEYQDDVEQATAHLLEDSLPAHLQSLDRSESAPAIETSDEQHRIEHLAPRSTPPLTPFIPSRRNVFDSEDLTDLASDTSRLHIGKKDRLTKTKDEPSNKAAILSALAAFDTDDDERDDTYDVDDVGGMVDTAHPDGEPGPSAKVTQEENEMALFTAYKSSPELFGRTFNIRRGQPRIALKAETGMTDEMIEGWAIMLARDPKRLKKLEARAAGGGAAGFDGRQTELGSTAYRESPGGTETEDSDVGGAGAPGAGSSSRGGFRGRGRGRGGRGGSGRGGSVAGPSGEHDTVQAQRRKEASKGSRANHNRRDQRAKKMARGGFPG